jgi:hypothetical protein
MMPIQASPPQGEVMTDGPDTASVPIEVTIIGHEAVKHRGTLIAWAIIDVDIAGVVIRLQGVEIHQSRLGRLTIAAPQFRAANGVRHAAVLMPPEVMRTALELFVQERMEPKP